jgi:oligosaccharide repeat unit polymerase
MAYILPLAILGATYASIRLLHRRETYIVEVLLSMWIAVISLHWAVAQSGYIPLFEASAFSTATVIGGILALTLGFVITNTFWSRPARSPSLEGPQDPPKSHVDLCLIAFAIATLSWVVGKARELSGGVLPSDAPQALRVALNYEGAEWGVGIYACTFVYVSSVYVITLNRPHSRRARVRGYALLLIAIAIALLTTQRTAVFMLIIAVLFSKQSGLKVSAIRIFLFAAVLGILFVSSGILLKKAGALDSSLLANADAGFQSILYYILSPLSALGVALESSIEHTNGQYTLRFADAVLRGIGAEVSAPMQLTQQFVNVPLPANAYTFIHAPYLDYGWGYLIYHTLLGAGLGRLFRTPRPSTSLVVIRSIAFYPVILTFFQDQFLTLTSQWIQVAVFCALLRVLYHSPNSNLRYQHERTQTFK